MLTEGEKGMSDKRPYKRPPLYDRLCTKFIERDGRHIYTVEKLTHLLGLDPSQVSTLRTYLNKLCGCGLIEARRDQSNYKLKSYTLSKPHEKQIARMKRHMEHPTRTERAEPAQASLRKGRAINVHNVQFKMKVLRPPDVDIIEYDKRIPQEHYFNNYKVEEMTWWLLNPEATYNIQNSNNVTFTIRLGAIEFLMGKPADRREARIEIGKLKIGIKEWIQKEYGFKLGDIIDISEPQYADRVYELAGIPIKEVKERIPRQPKEYVDGTPKTLDDYGREVPILETDDPQTMDRRLDHYGRLWNLPKEIDIFKKELSDGLKKEISELGGELKENEKQREVNQVQFCWDLVNDKMRPLEKKMDDMTRMVEKKMDDMTQMVEKKMDDMSERMDRKLTYEPDKKVKPGPGYA